VKPVARQQIYILYSVGETVDSVTMLQHCTVVKMINGQDEEGRKIKDAIFRDAHRTVRYELD
jgi:hypothetical protein